MSPDPSSAYRVTAGTSATPVRLVIMLYEQLIKDMQRAVTAIEKKDVEDRSREISHALLVLGQLQGTLDHERGGEVAANLDRLYFLMRADLVEAQFKVAPYLLQKHMKSLIELREAWQEVERSETPAASPASTVQPAAQAGFEKTASWRV